MQVGGEIDFPAVWRIVRRILFIETLQQKGFFKSKKRDHHFPGAEGFSYLQEKFQGRMENLGLMNPEFPGFLKRFLRQTDKMIYHFFKSKVKAYVPTIYYTERIINLRIVLPQQQYLVPHPQR